MLSHGQNDLTEHLACSRAGWVGVEHEKEKTDRRNSIGNRYAKQLLMSGVFA